MKKCKDIRRYNGKYRVYWVEHFTPCNTIEMVMYSLKDDVMMFRHHMRCRDWGFYEFDTKEEAQAYLNENRGNVWW